MIKAAQSLRDKILLELANRTGKRGDLRSEATHGNEVCRPGPEP